VAERRGVVEDDRALVERYESLRERALGAAPDGHRLGLAVLLGGGVVSWMAAWRERVPAKLAPQPPPTAPPPREDSEEIVRVLAAMALACAKGA
jgi:hypothetical protein